jgi:hypothetical protein
VNIKVWCFDRTDYVAAESISQAKEFWIQETGYETPRIDEVDMQKEEMFPDPHLLPKVKCTVKEGLLMELKLKRKPPFVLASTEY